MCCFSAAVSASNTSIFARDAGDGRQYLIYSMHAKSAGEVAMVLPLPVPKGVGDDAVTFIDLSDYPLIFKDLFDMMGFFGDRAAVMAIGGGIPKGLPVHDVGAFEASFVPTIADFSRLDERFRLPAGTWEKLPAYREYGFAVFKLKAGEHKPHPMAFSFPRADAATIFFPTVHIHDGTVHQHAEFDHLLYAQVGERHIADADQWHESARHAGGSVDIKRTAGTIAGDQHVYCKQMNGKLPNLDTLLKFG
jgi:hypothetical protein